MTFAAVEKDLPFLFLALPDGARSAVARPAVFLCYSCLIVLTEVALLRVFGRPGCGQRAAPRSRTDVLLDEKVHSQQQRLRRMVMHDGAAAGRPGALEVARGASIWALTSEWGADRLVRERSG